MFLCIIIKWKYLEFKDWLFKIFLYKMRTKLHNIFPNSSSSTVYIIPTTLIKIPNTYIDSMIKLKKKILFAFNFWILCRENCVLRSLFLLPLRIYSFENVWSTSYCWIYMLKICLKNPFFHWIIYFYGTIYFEYCKILI